MFSVFPIYKFKLVFLLSEQQTMFALLIFLFCLLSCKMLSIIRHFVSTTIANSSDRMWFASLQKILEFLWNVCFQDSFFDNEVNTLEKNACLIILFAEKDVWNVYSVSVSQSSKDMKPTFLSQSSSTCLCHVDKQTFLNVG